MSIITEGTHAGEFISSEANKTLSREAIVVLSGRSLAAAMVLGIIEVAGATSTPGTNTGDGAMGAITVGAGAQEGDYKLKITKAAANAGDFELIDPQGDVAGIGTVGVAFAGGGLSFTLADGAADFVVGDNFTLTVAPGSKKYVQLDPAAVNGAQHAAGVLFDAVDATSADAPGVAIKRLAELNAAEIIWPNGISDADKATAIERLAANAVVLR